MRVSLELWARYEMETLTFDIRMPALEDGHAENPVFNVNGGIKPPT